MLVPGCASGIEFCRTAFPCSRLLWSTMILFIPSSSFSSASPFNTGKKMVDIRERKKASPSTASSKAASKAGTAVAEKKGKKAGGTSALVSFAIVLAVITAATLATSFVLTKSLTFGYDLNRLHKYVPVSGSDRAASDAAVVSEGADVPASASEQKEMVVDEDEAEEERREAEEKKIYQSRKNQERQLITLTTSELKEYDGTDPSKPVYLAINRRVYDVTAGREKYYGPNGGYNFFSGVDAARAYITGCFQTHLTHDLRGLSQAEIDSLSQWSDFYEKHDTYFYVGEVVHDPIPEDAPLPEPCM